MTMQIIRHIAVAALLTLVAVLPVNAQKWDMDVAADSTLRMDSTFFLNDARQLYRYYFIEAVAKQNQGKNEEAIALFQQCTTINPDAAEAYYELAGHYDGTNDSLARYCYERAAQLQPANNSYLEELGRFYIRQSEYPAAIDAYERLYTANKSNRDAVETLLRLHYVQNDMGKVLEMLDRMETIDGISEDLVLSKMQIYSKLGKTSKELDELKRLVARYPNDPKYRIMMGNWLLGHKRTKEALAIFRTELKNDPDNADAQLSMLDYYRETGENAKADNLLEKLLFNTATPRDTRVTLLQQIIYYSEDNDPTDSVRIMRAFDRLLEEPQEDNRIYTYKLGYMAAHGALQADLNVVLQQAIANKPDDGTMRWLLISGLWDENNWTEMIEQSRIAQEYTPTEMLFYYSEGIAEFQLDNRDGALEAFRKGVAQINEDSRPNLVSDLYGTMGDLLYDKGLEAEAFAAYDSCLTYNADNVSALNNYAYYLCMKDSLLDRAEQMSRKAIDEEPDNSTYLDTYAWILFCQGRYAEALTTIEHAIECDDELSGVVKEHTGDIYAMNGDIENALKYWRMALEFDKDNALLQQKISEQRYIKE